MCVKLVRAHIGPLQTLMTLQDSQGAGTHMDIEGRSRDNTVLTALTHTRGSLSTRQIEMLPFQPSQFLCWPLKGRPCHRHCLDLCTLLASAVFVWLPLHCIRAPFNQTGLRHAYCHQRSKGLRHPLLSLHPGHFGQPPDNRCHHTPKQAVSQLHMVTLWWGASFFLPHPC